MGEMSERLKGFLGLQTKPTVVTPEGIGVDVKPFTPPTHFDQAKVMERPTVPPTHTTHRARTGQPENKPHKGRKALAGGVAVATLGGGGYLGYNALQNSTETTTPTPVTTIVDVTTPPLTSPETTTVTVPSTTEAPTTTVQEKPTDVVEHREGYDVLRNGALLYSVESITIDGKEVDTSNFGGFELAIQSGSTTFGFSQEQNDGVLPQETLLRDTLWAFGNQHPEFVNTDGIVDIEAYVNYLEQNNWIDTVVLPTRASDDAKEKMPNLKASEPQKIDLKLPFAITNDSPSLLTGIDASNANYYKPTIADDGSMAFGLTPEGQLYYGLYGVSQNGTTKPLEMKHPYESYPISDKLGFILTATGRITSPTSIPTLNWAELQGYFLDKFMVNPTGVIPPYPILDIFDYVGISGNHGTNRLFAPVNE